MASDDQVECEWCGALNPADSAVCSRCRRTFWTGLHGRGSAGARSSDMFSRHVGSLKPREARSGPAGWKVVAAAIAIVVVVVVSGLALYRAGYFGASGASGSSQTDLCVSPQGLLCNGYQFGLPSLQGGREFNVSLCESIVPRGSGDHVDFSYTSTVPMYAVILPSVLYYGPPVSLLYDPAGYFNNATAVGQSAWNSGLVSGHQSVKATIPSSNSLWCLAWWDPGAAGTVGLTTDVNLTYSS